MKVDTELGTGMVGGDATPEAVEEHIYVFPVTFAQQRLLFLDQLDPNSTSYSVPWSIRLTGDLNVVALERSLNEIVRRHETLRTTFNIVEDQPVQIVSPLQYVPLDVEDLSVLPDPEQAAQAAALKEAQTPVDLKNGPIIRTELLRLGPADHVLLVTTHHIVFDGWSRRILVNDLAALYEAFCAGRTSPLPELELQYADYAVWQRNHLQGENLDQLLNYWKQQLAGAPTTLDLPTDRPRPAVQSFRGAAKGFVLPKSLSEAVVRSSRQFGVTPFMTLLGGFQTVLSRYSGQNDILVGATIANRNRPEVEGLIGFFANTLPLRTRFDGDPTFRELLQRVKETALGAYAHQEMPFERLVEELRPERSLSHNPLFQVLFSLQNSARRAFELSEIQVKPLGGVVGTTAKFDMSVFLLEGQDGLSGRIEYNTDLFDGSTIDRILRHYLLLLEAALANPEIHISALPLLTREERQQIVVDWNATEIAYPCNLCVHDLFAQQARTTPDRVAVVFGDQKLTYDELNARSNQLARYLQKRGVSSKSLVGLMVERSPDMVVALLGILKAGAAYLPLDPVHPKDRTGFILQDAAVSVLLTQRSLADALPEAAADRICLDTIWPSIANESSADLPSSTQPEDLAYVLYTSGSTGKPKGVEIEHRNLVNFLTGMQAAPGLRADDVLVAVTTLSFDIAGLELYLPLICGAKVVLASREQAAHGEELSRLLTFSGATVMQATPATWRMLLDAGWHGDPKLKILCGGEAFPPDLANQLLPLCGELWNMYGPTETTIWSSVYRIERKLNQVASIGRPIANTTMYILGAHNQPEPIGVLGDLYIGGDGVARGYLNRPDLTAERFIDDPFRPGERIYRTGDLAYYLPDGNIQFQGRADFQVKLRGFRIELGEIEAELAKHSLVEQAVVAIREDRPGDKRLVGYVIPKSGQDPSPAELRAHLAHGLPDYMIPNFFMKVASLPLTPNGKIDRLGLPKPDWSQFETGNKSAPSDQFEAILVRIWERVLGVSNIGVDDDFFDLGGHSLLAVRLLSEVEKVVGRKIPLASLFRGSTVASLAELIRDNSESDPEPLVVELHPGDGSTPLFTVAAPGVRTLGYAVLARHVGAYQGVYKIQAQSPVANLRPLSMDEIRSLARQYVSAMRAVQPQGPYFVVAMCVGCHIAEQMILQLESQGQEVALFGIFDAWVLENVHRKLQWKIFNHLQRLRVLRQMTLSQQAQWFKRVFDNRLRIWTGKADSRTLWDQAYWPENFSAPRFHAPVVLFKRPKQPYYYIDDPHMGWSGRTEGGVEVHEISADHHEMLREPHVRVVGRVLAGHLRPESRRPEPHLPSQATIQSVIVAPST